MKNTSTIYYFKIIMFHFFLNAMFIMQIKYYLIKHAVIFTNASAYIFLFIHTHIDRSI